MSHGLSNAASDQNGDLDRALCDLTHAMKLDSTLVLNYGARGSIHEGMGLSGLMEKCCLRAVRHDLSAKTARSGTTNIALVPDDKPEIQPQPQVKPDGNTVIQPAVQEGQTERHEVIRRQCVLA